MEGYLGVPLTSSNEVLVGKQNVAFLALLLCCSFNFTPICTANRPLLGVLCCIAVLGPCLRCCCLYNRSVRVSDLQGGLGRPVLVVQVALQVHASLRTN